MRASNVEFAEPAVVAPASPDPVRKLAEILPRPLRFLAVGGLGLITDLAVFTLVDAHQPHPLLARLVSLAIATVVTWRLNRALTFDRCGRHPADEAFRYASVAAAAQTISYGVFALLVLTVFASAPQLALVAGAGFGAFVSYCGQAQIAFRPHARTPAPQSSI
jgi:putative flippase GtrA